VAETAALRYELVLEADGWERRREWTAERPLASGDLLLVGGRYWLVDRVESPAGGQLPRAVAMPARYRLSLRHPDGRIEAGALRRLRASAPRLGHAFATTVDGEPVSWQVVDERLAHDERGRAYLELVAARDFGELETLPDHELEHMLEHGVEEGAAPAGAMRAGGASELVALPAGEEPSWDDAAAAIESLTLDELGADVLELCGVDPDTDAPARWLELVQRRLRDDLERFRADIEDDRDEIQEWDVDGTRVFVSTGDWSDEANANSGHGWMCRLVDSGILAAAGFRRVRRTEL
jgi:hypothetical protein